MAPPTASQPTPEQVAAYARLEQARAAYRDTMAAFDRRTGSPEEGAALQLAYDSASAELTAALTAWMRESRFAAQSPEAA